MMSRINDVAGYKRRMPPAGARAAVAAAGPPVWYGAVSTAPPDTTLSPDALAERVAYRAGKAVRGERAVPEETAVALTYNKSTHAVMMASPADLEDFGIGFSLTEGVIDSPADVQEIGIARHEKGVEVGMWLSAGKLAILDRRRRHIAGPSGCGLCGMDSLDAAMRVPPPVRTDVVLSAEAVAAALAALRQAQPLHETTSAVHAAGFWHPARGLVAAREDIGRHNALDKLVGALARSGEDANGGVVLLTSRVSVEMVQKAAVLGAPAIIAVSAPSALAIRTAEAANITLIAVARPDGFEAFTHLRRIR
jgi:FdhD protein